MSEATDAIVSPTMLQSIDGWLMSIPFFGNEWVDFKLNSKTEKCTQVNNLFGISSAMFALSTQKGNIELPAAIISMVAAVFNLVMTRVKKKLSQMPMFLPLNGQNFSLA
jgi:hypothetical protein